MDASEPLLRSVLEGRAALDAAENELRKFREQYGNAGSIRGISAAAYRVEEGRLVYARDAAGAALQRSLQQYGAVIRQMDVQAGRTLKPAGAR